MVIALVAHFGIADTHIKHFRSLAFATVALAACVAVRKIEAQTPPAPTFIANYNCVKPAPALRANVSWTNDDGALKWGEWRIQIGERKLPVLIVVVMIAPKLTKLSLDIARDGSKVVPWSLTNAPATARFAMNAGQFTDEGPWGWVVHRGNEHQPPGIGAVAGALVVDSAGTWALLDANEIAARRGHNVLEAVQSYPTLIGANGAVPTALCGGANSIDLTHRDARLAVGTLAGGSLVIAMSRFDGLGKPAGRLPLGPTTSEMVTVMRSLGATRALMLDGGLSAQLLLRSPMTSAPGLWPGLRHVPLALIGIPNQ
ncbi:MAG: phosphodiester glycosidase family protein [Gemmatimonadaceae bacterium]